MALCLMYHNIVQSESDRAGLPREHRRYCLTREAFIAQLETAAEMGRRFVGPAEVLSEAALDPAAVLLTFDDSWSEHEWTARVLSERGIPAIFFMNSGCVGQSGMLSADAAAGIAAAGHEIGSHGTRHDFFTGMSAAALRRSLVESKAALEALCGGPVRFLSAPGGRWDARAREIAREAGYRALFTSRPGRLAGAGGEFVLNRTAVTADINPGHFRRMLAGGFLSLAPHLARYELARVVRVFTEKRGGEGRS